MILIAFSWRTSLVECLYRGSMGCWKWRKLWDSKENLSRNTRSRFQSRDLHCFHNECFFQQPFSSICAISFRFPYQLFMTISKKIKAFLIMPVNKSRCLLLISELTRYEMPWWDVVSENNAIFLATTAENRWRRKRRNKKQARQIQSLRLMPHFFSV